MPIKRLYFLGIVAMLLLSSCATYRMKNAETEYNLFNGDFKVAIASIDQNKFLLRDRNRLLYLMEKGKVEYLMGNFAKSNALFEQADRMIEDNIKSNVGQAIASKLTNANAEPYKGEDFEKVAIHYYQAMNYFALGQPDEALVEAKRINMKLLEMNDKYANNKNKYSADAFSQIVQGVLYEAVGDINNAFIAYRNAEELYAANNNQYYGVPMPNQLKHDLVRTAKLMGFTQEAAAYQKKFNIVTPQKGAMKTLAPEAKSIGEVIVFWENGLGPYKGQTKITVAPGLGAFSDEGGDLIIPIPTGMNIGITSIAIPKYLNRESYYQQASVTVDGKDRFFELSEDYYPIAKQCLKDRMLREALDIAVRVAAKKAASIGMSRLADQLFGKTASQITSFATDVTNTATEQADTRNWQTLPGTISYIRLPLKEGDNSFTLKRYGPNGVDEDTLHVMGKPGLQVLSYFDLGRTISVKN